MRAGKKSGRGYRSGHGERSECERLQRHDHSQESQLRVGQAFDASIVGMQTDGKMSRFEPDMQSFGINAQVLAAIGEWNRGHERRSFPKKQNNNEEMSDTGSVPRSLRKHTGNAGGLSGSETVTNVEKAGALLMMASSADQRKMSGVLDGGTKKRRASRRRASGTESGLITGAAKETGEEAQAAQTRPIRNARVSRARVMWRYQPTNERTTS